MRTPWPLDLDLESVTIRSGSRGGIDVDVASVEASRVEVVDCGGTAARLQLQGSSFRPAITVVDSRFSDNLGAGLEIGGDLDAESLPPTISGCLFERNAGSGLELRLPADCSRNTSVLNRGDGFRFTGAGTVNANIAAGNGAAGFVVEVGADVDLRHNDAWMNHGPGYQGGDLDDNLEVDPHFCDPLRGDYHLTSSSLCAPTGPHGQIGAFGAACDASTVAIDVRPGSPENIIGQGGVLPVAILSHRFFDARRVDPTSIRLEGAQVLDRPRPLMRDVNGDGLVDFVAHVDARALRIPPGSSTAQLEGFTLDGTPIQATDEIRLAGPRAPGASALSVAPTAALSLAIQSVRALSNQIRVVLALPSSEPASLEMFDLAGRRLAHHQLRLLSGSQEVELPLPTEGIYWLR
ncbi:MAG TPA: right-handed parallel beta-helix repeat-containing protein, partial [Candidatus Eisenbacteria bacterium]|nr:right-handed parallel beta-helix repeat-containing protein [Candidatus Eisenbacteria bacterium]